jgi:hypothetical protein
VGILTSTVYRLCLQLESAGEVVQVDSWLCQPTGTPIPGQLPGRLRVTFVVVVYIETDVLRPIHIRIERIIVFVAHVQTTFNPLILICICFPAHATRLSGIAFVYFVHFNIFHFRLARENLSEVVERPLVQVEVAVPVFRLAIAVFTHSLQLTNIDSTNLCFNTLLNDVLAETEKKWLQRALHFAWSRVCSLAA